MSMAKRLFWAGLGLDLAVAGVALVALQPAQAQGNLLDAPKPTREIRAPELPDRLPNKPSQAPAFKVPVEPLGFSAPGPLYLGQRNSLRHGPGRGALDSS
jgi:hypothetical protein